LPRVVVVLFQVAAFVLILSTTVALVSLWSEATNPVFPQRPHSFVAFSLLHYYGIPDHDDWDPYAWETMPTIMTSTLFQKVFGVGYRSIMMSQTFYFALTIILLSFIALRIGGPTAAILTAGFASFLPGLLAVSIAYDDHAFNLFLTTAAVAALLMSNKITRTWPLVAAGICIGIVMRHSFRPTVGILACAAVLSALGGMFFESLLNEKKSPITAVSNSLKNYIPVLLRIALFLVCALIVGQRHGIGDHIVELSNEVTLAPERYHPYEPYSFFVYSILLVRSLLGPIVTLAAVVGIVGLFRHKTPHRFTLIAWFLGLNLALSIIPRKNDFYIFYVMIAAAPIAGVGISAFNKRWANFLGVLLIASSALFSLHCMSASPIIDAKAKVFEYLDLPSRIFLQPPYVEKRTFREEVEEVLATIRRNKGAREVKLVVMGSAHMDDEYMYYFKLLAPQVRLVGLMRAAKLPELDKDTYLMERIFEPGEHPMNLHELFRHSLETRQAFFEMKDDDPAEERLVRAYPDLLKMFKPVFESDGFTLFASNP